MTATPVWTRSQALLDAAIARVAGAEGLDALGDRLAAAAEQLLHGDVARSTLSGTVSGHPMHPPLTDLAMGLLQSASLLDLAVPTRWARRASTTLTAVGLAMVVPTALTGLHDWSDTQGRTRRVGVAHAATNSVATALYAVSLVTGLRGGRVVPRIASGLGLLTLLVGGFLGGDLAYRRGVGVDHTAFDDGPQEWTAAAVLDEVPLEELHAVTVDGVDIALFRTFEGVFAVADTCSHLGGPLSEGSVSADGREVACPWHGSRFRLNDGCVTRGPASAPQPTYRTRVVDGMVEVTAQA